MIVWRKRATVMVLMRLPNLLILPLFAAAAFGAGDPLNAPVPLGPKVGDPHSAGEDAIKLQAAQRAQLLGFPTTAASLYRELLSDGQVDRPRVSLMLATALLDSGELDTAERTLDAIPGPKPAAWHLRKALLADAEGRADAARSEFSGTRFDDLPAADRGWYYFLQGRLSEDPARAAAFYEQSVNSAASELQKTRFQLAREQAMLRSGPVSAAQLDADRKLSETNEGQKQGYTLARLYAVALSSAGRKAEAIDVLKLQLRILPPQERAEADNFRFLLGVIAGAADSAGRHALISLLTEGIDPVRQRIALELLARGSGDGTARQEFKQTLDDLIATAHPILESLLLYRAELYLRDKDHARAEADANALLDKFPGSSLKPYARMVLTGSAWEQHRYRTAADAATKARSDMPAGPARSQISVLVAEAWYRAGDFRSAADAYAASLREPPPGVPIGSLMFQRVQSEIGAGNLTGAETVLDDMEKDPSFDPMHRWEAEWNLARALEVDGRTADALARVTRLLSEDRAASRLLSPELRGRVALLQARLSFEAHKPELTLSLVDALSSSVTGLSTDLQAEIISSGALLKAQADFDLKRDDDANKEITSLRATYKGSDAALYSYFVQADHAAQQDRIADALALYTALATDYPDRPYAPYALYQSALQAEQLGNLEDANQRIEELVALVAKYPNNDVRGLVFYARLKQGDLLRKLNQFPQAQQAYEALINSSPGEADAILARLALAECHNAQSSNDASHADRARTLFEDLLDRVDAPVEVRVEAGYNLGELSARENKLSRAQVVWWSEVVSPFLLDPQRSEQLGAKGRWWMSRTLLELGSLYERQGQLEEAKRAWLLILQRGLPGGSLARARLTRYHLPESAMTFPQGR